MAKLFCSKVTHNPFSETMITEIPEKIFQIDGYQIADRLLEGVMFNVKFDDSGVVEAKVDPQFEDYFSDFNTEKFYKLVKKEAENILREGDEVTVPDWIEKKYFKNGINVAYIQP